MAMMVILLNHGADEPEYLEHMSHPQEMIILPSHDWSITIHP